MNFDNPSWRRTPLRTSVRVAASLARRVVPGARRVVVPYDRGRARIYSDLGTPLGLELYRYGHRDPDLDFVRQLLSPGEVFVDGGAHIGLFTLVAAGRVGLVGKVIAVEPSRETRLRLLQNVVLNGFKQVEVFPLALSSHSGEAAFRVFEIGGAALNHLQPSEGEMGDVEVVGLATLDAIVTPHDRQRLSLVKLDLEGAEHAALMGASAILGQVRPDLLLEVEPAHLKRMGTSPEAIAQLLRGHGYTFYRPDSSQDGHSPPTLAPVADIGVPGPRPNIFATVNIERVRARGIQVF